MNKRIELARTVFIGTLLLIAVGCGSSDDNPNAIIAGNYNGGMFLISPSVGAAMMTTEVTLNEDGTGTTSETLSSGQTFGPAPLTYQYDGAGSFDFTSTGGFSLTGPHFFSRDASAYGYLYSDPDNSSMSLGIGFGVQPDRRVNKVVGLYHAFILEHTANTSFAVLQHDYVFSEDGTGTITVDGQTVGFTYAIKDGVITIQFPGSTHDPLSAFMSKDGQFMVAYDMTDISKNVGIRVFVKGADASGPADIKGEYYVIALRNTTGGGSASFTQYGTAIFDGQSTQTLIDEVTKQQFTSTYNVESNGAINIQFPGGDRDKGWISPNRELIIDAHTQSSQADDPAASFSILTRKW